VDARELGIVGEEEPRPVLIGAELHPDSPEGVSQLKDHRFRAGLAVRQGGGGFDVDASPHLPLLIDDLEGATSQDVRIPFPERWMALSEEQDEKDQVESCESHEEPLKLHRIHLQWGGTYRVRAVRMRPIPSVRTPAARETAPG
jgi:hypothetical protein